MAKKMTIFNTKGGAGKSTSSKSIAGELAKRGYKVLLVDCDSSGDTTRGIAHSEEPTMELAQLVSEYCNPDFAIEDQDPELAEMCVCPTDFENLFLIPASRENMQNADIEMARAPFNTDKVFSELLGDIEYNYDYIIYDIKEGEGQWVKNALNFTDYLLCPSEPTNDSLFGYTTVNSRMGALRRDNRKLRFLGLFLTKYTNDRKDQDILQIAREGAGDFFIPVAIRYSKTLDSARNAETPICYFKEDSNPAVDYASLTDYILEKTGDNLKILPQYASKFDIERLTGYTMLFYPESLLSTVKDGEKTYKKTAAALRKLQQEYDFLLAKNKIEKKKETAAPSNDDVWLTAHDDDYAALLEDVRTNGINEPVLVTPQTEGEYMVIDGAKRRDIALELSIELPIKIVWQMTGDDENAMHLETVTKEHFLQKTAQAEKEMQRLKKEIKKLNK
ncbi:AAA family ATPase [Anaerovoracaceae bacterium 42-11]